MGDERAGRRGSGSRDWGLGGSGYGCRSVGGVFKSGEFLGVTLFRVGLKGNQQENQHG